MRQCWFCSFRGTHISATDTGLYKPEFIQTSRNVQVTRKENIVNAKYSALSGRVLLKNLCLCVLFYSSIYNLPRPQHTLCLPHSKSHICFKWWILRILFICSFEAQSAGSVHVCHLAAPPYQGMLPWELELTRQREI